MSTNPQAARVTLFPVHRTSPLSTALAPTYPQSPPANLRVGLITAEVVHIRPTSLDRQTGSDRTNEGPEGDAFGPGAEPSDPGEHRRHWLLRQAIGRDLRALGVVDRDRLFLRFELAELAEAVVYVRETQEAGHRLYSPAGLVLWRLKERTGRAVR